MKKLLYCLGFLSLITIYSCSKDESNPTNPGGGASGTFGGDWMVDNVQLVSAPSGSSASAVMKQALVPFGSISGSFAGYLNITFGAETMQQTSTNLSSANYPMIFFGNTGYAFTYNSSYILRKSDNGGASWTNITIPVTSLYSTPNVSIINSTTIFLLLDTNFSSPKRLYKSVNSGVNWTLVSTNTGINPVLSGSLNTAIDFVNDTLGFAIGRDGFSNPKLYKTINGGVNWTIVAGTPSASAIDFTDENNGFQIKNNTTFSKTADGGVTWTDYAIGSSFYTFSMPVFVGNTGWIAGSDNSSYALYKTQNGGTSWTKVSSSVAGTPVFKNENEGYGVFDGIPLKTNNSGANWVPYASSANTGISRITLVNNSPAFFTSSGTLYKPTGSTDTSKWIATGQITNSAIKIITRAEDNETYANGEFSVSGNNIVFTTSNYSNGANVAAGSGTYSFDSGYLSITLNLPNAEVWKIKLRRR